MWCSDVRISVVFACFAYVMCVCFVYLCIEYACGTYACGDQYACGDRVHVSCSFGHLSVFSDYMSV